MVKKDRNLNVISISGIGFTIFFLLVSLLSPVIIEETAESLLLDYRFQLRNVVRPPSVPEDIIIVEIDDRTLEKYGSWPLNRSVQAKLVKKILSGRPKVLAVDIFYAERQNRQADEELARALNKSPGRVVLATGFDMEAGGREEAPEYLWDDAIMKIKHQSDIVNVTEVNKLKVSAPGLYSHALIGHVYSPPGLDGKLRWEHLFIKYLNDYYPSLSIVTAARSIGKGTGDIIIYGGRGVAVGGIFIPTDPSGRMRINYLGREGIFIHRSAADVLKKDFDASVFSGRIVLLGTTAISTYDFAVTPFSARMPGVEKNATVIENILHRRFIEDVPVSVTCFLILVTGLFLSFALPKMKAIPGISLALVVVILFTIVNQYLFTYHGRYMNFIYPFATIFFISIFSTTYKYVTEERRARELRKMFSSYVSPKIVEELINNPGMAGLGGRKKEITIIFSDIMGFTSFSEKHEPEEVVAMLNDYFREMADIIFRWDGTLDKFVGDEIMAFWGAPIDQPDHAERAVRCALNMSDRLDELQKRWQSEGKPVLDCGIGINTGIVLIGNIGAAGKKMDYTAIGDHVNLGARVEALTRQYDSRILITEHTYRKVSDLIERHSLGHAEIIEGEEVRVKGKRTAVKLFRLKALPHKTKQ